MIPQLTPKQIVHQEATREAFRHHRRVVSCAPTGFGKTVVAADTVAKAQAKGKRTVITAPRIEIAEQISEALTTFGVEHDFLRQSSERLVSVMMMPTLARRGCEPPDFAVVDEGHHALCASWRRVLDAWPSTKILYLTATPARLDGQGMGEIADVLVTAATTRELIADGWLARFRYFAPPSICDLSEVKRRGGDYIREQLGAAMDKPSITGDAIDHWRRLAPGKPTLVFCVSRAHAESVAESFRDTGVEARSLHGGLLKAERRSREQGFRTGQILVLTTVNLVTEGYDVPGVECIMHLRPTASLALFRQINGRGLRRKPDGARCIILDHVGNRARHGLPAEEIVWSLDGKLARESVPPVHQCVRCFACDPEGCAEQPCSWKQPTTPRKRVLVQRAGELVELTDLELTRWSGLSFGDAKKKARTREELEIVAALHPSRVGPGWVDDTIEQRRQWHAGIVRQWQRGQDRKRYGT